MTKRGFLMGYNFFTDNMEQIFAGLDLAINWRRQPGLGRINVIRKGRQFWTNNPDDPIQFLDVIDRKTEPKGSKIARFLTNRIRLDEKINPEFHNLDYMTANLIMAELWGGVKDVRIVQMTPGMTVITPVGDITSIGAFRDNPEFAERYSIYAKRVPMRMYKDAAYRVRDYYQELMKRHGVASLIDWQAVQLLPHTLRTRNNMDARLSTESIGFAAGTPGKLGEKLLLTFQQLNYYYSSTDDTNRHNHFALHTKKTEKTPWGKNEMASMIISDVLNSFSEKAKEYITVAAAKAHENGFAA
jgi:hypothetical protein